ncbi:hypothetical protein LN050_03560 [Comamonadaceae bacterium M7527]|nr:hypothetical protein LN050_03560 [Comamonadaceae bacterium M7527]
MEDGKWHLDRRVNLSIIITLVVTIGSGLFGYGVLNERVDENSRAIAEIKHTGLSIEERLDKISEQLFELIGIMNERSK